MTGRMLPELDFKHAVGQRAIVALGERSAVRPEAP